MIFNRVPKEKFQLDAASWNLSQGRYFLNAQEIEFDYKASDSKSRQNNNIYGDVIIDKYNPICGYYGSNYMSKEWCYD